MTTRFLAGGRLAIGMIAALLMTFTASAEARASVSRDAAAQTALKAFKVQSDTRAVRVFGLLRQLAPGTEISESAPGTASATDPKTGVQSGAAKSVIRTKSRVWLFYADRGPHQGFEHPGQLALVDVATGKVTLSRTTNWVPLIDGKLPEFFATADAYEGKRFVVFDRPWPGQFPTTANASRVPDQAAQQRAANALAAQHACVLRLSDTLGDFFDFGRVDQTRAQLGIYFKRLSELNPGFKQERYLPRLGRTPTQEAQRLINQGCKDLTIYAAGAAQKSGGDVLIGLRASNGRVSWQKLDAAALKALMAKNPKVSFKLIFDAPYTDRLGKALRSQPNAAVIVSSGGPNEASFTYLPALIGPQGVVANPSNPRHLLEFTNGLIDGLDLFQASSAEVDQALEQQSTTFMGWMLARALNIAKSPLTTHATTPVTVVTPTPIGDTKVNQRPHGALAAQTTEEDHALSLMLNGVDDDGGTLAYTVTSQPAHGTLTGTAPLLTYTPDPDFNGADAFTYRVSDGTDSSDPITVNITVNPVDDASVLTTSTGRASYTEDDAPVVVDPNLTLSDIDSDTITGATVETSDTGVLGFSDANGITGNFHDGTLTLTGSATVADYQDALRGVTFEVPGDDPSTTARTITFSVPGASAQRTVDVVAVDDPTVLTAGADNAHYTEDGTPTAIAPDVAISDPDTTTLDGATVTIAGGEATDVLEFKNAALTGQFAGGVLTLSGTATLATYQAALRSVTFRTTSENPSQATRTLTIVAGGSLTRSLTVARHNDAPTVTTSAGNAAYTENAAATLVDPDVTVADVDSANLHGATVTYAAESGDTVTFSTAGTINGTLAAAGTVTFSGTATVAQYEQTLRSIRFASTSENPTTSRTFTYKVTDDGDTDSATATKALTITPVNDAPTLAGTSSALSYTENGPAAAVQPNLTISDPDSANLAGATVTIIGAGATDVLHYAGLVPGQFANGVLTLSGTASIADYRDSLRSVTFEATGENPDAGPRTLRITVSDGDTSGPLDRGLNVTAVDDAPVLTSGLGTTPYPERGAAVIVDPDLTLTDVDSPTLTGATAKIKTGGQTGDALSFDAPPAGITGIAAGDTVTFTGNASAAAYQAALRGVRFGSTNHDPSAARTIAFSATDGTLTSNEGTKALAVDAINDAPDVTTSGGTTTYTEDDPATVIDGALTVTDSDSTNLRAATLTIANALPEDSLVFTDTANIHGTYTGGTLTLSGTDTQAAYQVALRSVRYRDSSQNPDTTPRTITFTASDGTDASAPATKSVAVVAVDDPTSVTTSPGATTFTEDGGAVVVDSGVTLADPDSTTVSGATVTTSGDDQLQFTDAGPIHGGFSGKTLTLTGTDTLANYQAALRSVSFNNPSQDPSTADRTITFTIAGQSATKTVKVVAINDAPTVTQSDPALAYTENDAATAIAPNLDVNDPDNTNLASATVKLTGGEAQDALGFSNQNGIIGSVSGNTLTLNGTATVAQYRTALRSVTFVNPSDNPSAATRTVSFTVSDGSLTGSAGRDIAVTPVDDAPTATSESYSGVGNTALTTTTVTGPHKTLSANLLAHATDPDDTTLHTVAVTSAATTAGGSVTIDANGNFTFLPKAGTTSDTFTYQVTDGNKTSTATVTITLTGMVWYVDATASGDGTSYAPAAALATVTAKDAAGQTIYVAPGTYGAGTLENSETLASTRTGLTGLDGAHASDARPVLGTLTLGKDSTVSGVAPSAITGSSVGTATFADATFGALTIGGTANVLDAKFASGGGAVSIAGASGSLAVDAGSLSGLSLTSGSLSSTVAANVASGAVAISGITGTTALTGKLTVSSFAASGGGTITATGTGSALTGPLTVDGATIGAGNVTFQSVAGVITLNQTGTAGHLAVTGAGSACSSAANCTGGTSTGISLTDTQAPSFTRMYITGAITGTTVRGFTLDNSVLTGAGAKFTDLSGSAAVTNSSLSGGTDNLRVTNNSGTLNRLTIQNSTFGAASNDALNVESLFGGTATLNVTVDHTTFTSAAGDLFQAVVDGSGGGDVAFTNNTLSNNNAAIASGVGGVSLEGARGGDTTFTVTGNTQRDARGTALLLVHGQGTKTLAATVTGNAIGVAGAANSGSLEGQGISVEHNGGGGTLNADVSNNQIRQYNGEGIRVLAGAGVADSGNLNVNVAGNTVTQPGTNAAISAAHWGLLLNNGVTPGDTFATCLSFNQVNAFSGSGRNGGQDFRLRQRQSTTVKLAGYGGGATDTSAVNAYVAGKLGGGSVAGTSVFDNSGFGTAASCVPGG